MPYAIVLYFDQKTEEVISGLWKRLADEGISSEIAASGIRPHLTLAIYDELKCQPCENELSRLAADSSFMLLNASHLGIFYQPDLILFLAPTPGQALLAFHARIHTNIAVEAQGSWPLYQPGRWVPHCTLAMNLTQDSLSRALPLCAALPLPLEMRTTQVGAVEFLPVKDLFCYSLKEG